MSRPTTDERKFMDRVLRLERPGVADRAADKVRQKCRRAGWVKFARSENRWAITDLGRAALANGDEG